MAPAYTLHPMPTKSSYDPRSTASVYAHRARTCCADSTSCCTGCFHRHKSGWCLAFFVLLIGGIWAVVNVLRLRTSHVSAWQVIPYESDWVDYLGCVRNEECVTCKRPMTTFVQPSKRSVVILAPRGTGGGWFRQLVHSGYSVWTGIDDCFSGNQMFSMGRFDSECAGPFFFRHYVAVRILGGSRLGDYPGFEPDVMIHVRRNPLDAIISAHHFYTQCSGKFSGLCVLHGQGASEKAFTGPNSTFRAHAVNHAAYLVATQRAYDKMQGKEGVDKIQIYYEDMQKDLRYTLNASFTLLSNAHKGYVTSVRRAMSCALLDTDTYMKRSSDIVKHRVFDEDLLTKVCAIVAPIWNPQKWGPSCM